MKCTSIDIPENVTNIKNTTFVETPRSEQHNQTLETKLEIFKNETVPELKKVCESFSELFEKILTVAIVTGGLTGIVIILYQFVLLVQLSINKKI